MTTLAIHPGALGDVLLAVPALRALRAARRAPLRLAAQPRIGALLTALGVVDAHADFDTLGLEPLFVDEPGSAGVDALRSASHVVCWFAARDPVFTRRLREEAPGAIIASPPGDGARPVWEHLLATIAHVADEEASTDSGTRRSADPVQLRVPVDVPATLREDGKRALVAAGWDGLTPLVVLHPGAGGLGKRWGVEGFVAVVRTALAERPLALALHRGPADTDAAAALASRLPAACAVLHDVPLVTLAGALCHAALWLGNDSGVTHLAAAVGAPTLALFERSKLAWQPWSVEARVEVVDTSSVAAHDVEAVCSAVRDVLKRIA